MEVSWQKNSNKCCKMSFKSARNSLLVIVHNFKIWFLQGIESKISCCMKKCQAIAYIQLYVHFKCISWTVWQQWCSQNKIQVRDNYESFNTSPHFTTKRMIWSLHLGPLFSSLQTELEKAFLSSLWPGYPCLMQRLWVFTSPLEHSWVLLHRQTVLHLKNYISDLHLFTYPHWISPALL